MKRSALLVGSVAIAVALAGCASTSSPRVVDYYPTTTAGPAVPDDHPLAAFYNQQVTWSACRTGLQCASITVPLDWDDPGGETITVALAKRPADNPAERKGSLLVNPGGPGGSGVQFLDSIDYVVSKNVRAVYDIVGFDPRGVGESTAVDCVDDAQLDELRAASYPVTPEGIAEMSAADDAFAAACGKNSGDLLAHVDTESAARDMDVMRAVVGDTTLTYLGYSYGTFLGSTYAQLFPDTVGRLVLDGAMDPSLDIDQMSLDQAAGFENALKAYLTDCVQGASCPFTDVDSGIGEVRSFIDSLVDDPLPTGDPARPLTQSLGVSGIITSLYSDEYWPYLTRAMSEALTDSNGARLLELADLGADRDDDGTYAVNSTEANIAINCVDYPVNTDMTYQAEDAEHLEQASPTFWDSFAYGDLTCENWPAPPTRTPAPVSADGAAPIVVIGTVGDPATPYQWAQSLSSQLSSAVLVTWNGQGHTAYGRGSSCITSAVDGFLLDGVVPQDGLTCD